MAIVLTGAGLRTMLPARRLLPTTKVLSHFPARLGPYAVAQEDFPDSEATRRAYAPAEIVYRDYAASDGVPINLFVAPEPVGWDTPAVCTTYQGSVTIRMSVLPVVGVPGLLVNQIVSRPPGAEDSISVCAYYWRTAGGPVQEKGLNIATGKLAGLAGRNSFRVDMCTEIQHMSQLDSASERLMKFAAAVDPVVRRRLQEAIDTGK